MKKRITSVLAMIAIVAFIIPVTVTGQENKEKEIEKTVEKRIKIVAVDNKGEKTIIDTILTGDDDMESILIGKDLEWISEEDIGEKVVKTEEGNVFVYSTAGDKKFSVYAKGDSKLIDKEGDTTHNSFVWAEKPAKLKDGQVHIIIHSKNEVEDLLIDGDAVITIKDGKVKVEGDGLKMNISEEGEAKSIKEKKVKKEKRK